jgi:hypothetical protein
MIFTLEHKRFIIESNFRNCVFNNGEWTYSAVACLAKFKLKQVYATKNTSMHSRASERLNIRPKSQRLL